MISSVQAGVPVLAYILYTGNIPTAVSIVILYWGKQQWKLYQVYLWVTTISTNTPVVAAADTYRRVSLSPSLTLIENISLFISLIDFINIVPVLVLLQYFRQRTYYFAIITFEDDIIIYQSKCVPMARVDVRLTVV